MGRIYDISNPLNSRTLAYPGDPAFRLEQLKEIGPDSTYNLSQFSMGSHCGSHIDAPAHFIADGKRIHEFPPDRWVMRALVLSVDGEVVSERHIPGEKLRPGMALLLKTKNSACLREGRFPEHPCEVDTGAAEKLVALGVGLVGIDWLTIEEGLGPIFPVHEILLSHEVLIMESVLLDMVPEGEYTLYAAPLAIQGAEGAPVRALLIEE